MKGKTNANIILSVKAEYETSVVVVYTDQQSSSAIMGVPISVVCDGDTEEFPYNGIFSFKVPAGSEYAVSFGDVEGFNTPLSTTYTAQEGNTRIIEVIYTSV